MPRNASETFRERFGVAVRATWTDLSASPYRIPSCVSPLNFGTVAHERRSYLVGRNESLSSLTDAVHLASPFHGDPIAACPFGSSIAPHPLQPLLHPCA